MLVGLGPEDVLVVQGMSELRRSQGKECDDSHVYPCPPLCEVSYAPFFLLGS